MVALDIEALATTHFNSGVGGEDEHQRLAHTGIKVCLRELA